VEPVRRVAAPDDPLAPNALALDVYEAGRPSADDACRVGDSRFLNQTRGSV
jgi:hydrogenase maturation protease